jgi:hypothetical protein
MWNNKITRVANFRPSPLVFLKADLGYQDKC